MAKIEKSPRKIFINANTARTLYLTLLLTLMAAFAVVTTAPRLIDKDAFRTRFLTQIGYWVGAEVTSPNPLELSVFPKLKATLRDVVSKKSSALGHLRVKEVNVSFSVWAAMLGKIEGEAIELRQADFTLNDATFLKSRAFVSNPVENFLGLAASQIHDENTSSDLSSVSNERLGKITLIQSNVKLLTATGEVERFSDVNGALHWPLIHSDLALEAQAIWRGEPIKFDAKVQQPFVFIAGGYSEIDLNISAKPMALSFQGNANLASYFSAEGRVSWKTPSMDQFLNWTKAHAAAMKADHEIELDARVTVQNGKLLFNDMEMVFAGNTATGILELDSFASPIKTSGTLAFKSVNLPAIATSLPIGSSNENSKELSLLNALDLDLRLSAEEATISGFTIANVAGAIRLAKGGASIDIGSGEIAGGTVMGRLELSGPDKAKTGRLSLGVNNIHQNQLPNLDPSIPVLAYPLSGKLEITGPYRNVKSLLTLGTGTLSLESDVGLIRNFNLASIQTAIEQKNVFELPTLYAGLSEAKKLNVKAWVKSGVVVINSAHAVIDGRRVTFTGSIPLFSPNITLKGAIKKDNAAQAENKLSFQMSGTWSKPVITPLSSH